MDVSKVIGQVRSWVLGVLPTSLGTAGLGRSIGALLCAVATMVATTGVARAVSMQSFHLIAGAWLLGFFAGLLLLSVWLVTGLLGLVRELRRGPATVQLGHEP